MLAGGDAVGSAENDDGVTDTMRLSRTLIDCVR